MLKKAWFYPSSCLACFIMFTKFDLGHSLNGWMKPSYKVRPLMILILVSRTGNRASAATCGGHVDNAFKSGERLTDQGPIHSRLQDKNLGSALEKAAEAWPASFTATGPAMSGALLQPSRASASAAGAGRGGG